MNNGYEPTKGEILGEAFSQVRTLVHKDNIRETCNTIKEFSKTALGMGLTIVTAPYMIPTAVRKYRDVESSERKFEHPTHEQAQYAGAITGFFGGIGMEIAQLAGYVYLRYHDHPEVLAIPVATNVASGIYELGRSVCSNASQRLKEKRRISVLEKEASLAE